MVQVKDEKLLFALLSVYVKKQLLRLRLIYLFYFAESKFISEFFHCGVCDHAVKGHICFLLASFVLYYIITLNNRMEKK